MAWFSKKQKPTTVVPAALLSELAAFGKASWEAKLKSQPVRDERYGWDNFFSHFLSAYQTGVRQAIAEVHQAAGSDALARYGGYRLVAEFDGACKEPLYLDMMDAALEMMFERGLSSGHMTGYERDRWVDTHGDVRTSFDRIVEVDRPTTDATSRLDLSPGQSVVVALMGPDDLDNQFWVERVGDSAYRAFSMRLWDDDAVTLTRCEEDYLGTFDSVGGILRSIGDSLRTPSYWAHSELAPYFPERRNL